MKVGSLKACVYIIAILVVVVVISEFVDAVVVVVDFEVFASVMVDILFAEG